MNDKYKGDVLDVFRSKRFWSGLVGLVFMVLTAMNPDLKSNSDQLIQSILIVVSLLIGGYSVQDGINAMRAIPEQPPKNNPITAAATLAGTHG